MDFLNGKLSLDEFLDLLDDELENKGLKEISEKSIEDSGQNPANEDEKGPEKPSVYMAMRGLRKANEYQL